MKTFARSAAFLSLVLVSAVVVAADAPPAPVFPNVTLYELDSGDATSVEAFRGRPVVLSFWASWCGPCRAEMPEIEKMHEELAGRGLVIATVNTDSQPAAAHRFLERLDLDLPVYRMDARTMAQLGITSLPTTILLDAEGRAVQIYEGYTPVTCTDIRKRVEPLLEPAGPEVGAS